MTTATKIPNTGQSNGFRGGLASWLVAAAIVFTLLAGLPPAVTGAAAAAHHDAAASSPAIEDAGTAAAVRALTGPSPARAAALVPAGFAASLGYRPPMVGGYPIDPDGDCSSPVQLPNRFTPLCRTHDFGYDLLRYARDVGRPLGPWARQSLDDMLVHRMRESCGRLFSTDGGCVVAAEAAELALHTNTWRQHGGPPVANESGLRIATSMATRYWEAVSSTLSGDTP